LILHEWGNWMRVFGVDLFAATGLIDMLATTEGSARLCKHSFVQNGIDDILIPM